MSKKSLKVNYKEKKIQYMNFTLKKKDNCAYIALCRFSFELWQQKCLSKVKCLKKQNGCSNPK